MTTNDDPQARPRSRRGVWPSLIPALVVVAVVLVASVIVAATWDSDTGGAAPGGRLEPEPLLVLAAGGALGVLAGALIYSMGRSRELAYDLVDEVTGSLQRSEEHFRALVQHGHDLIVVADSTWRVQYVSPSVELLLGFEPRELLGLAVPEGLHPSVAPLAEAAIGGSAVGELSVRHRNGSWRSFEGVISDLRHEPAVQGFVVSVHDVTERQAAADQLAHNATHDPLTTLPNRVLLFDRLEHALARTARDPTDIAVLFLDLDRFKIVNDSLGHQAGDELLAEVAQRLRFTARDADTVARFGGDEFVIVCEDIDGINEATVIARRLISRLAEPILLGGHESLVGVSVGIAVAHGGSTTAEEMIRDADAAMYRAKERGGGVIEVFDPSMRTRGVSLMGTEALLRRALEDEQFVLHYLPVHDLVSGSIVGVEALVRWVHPERGLVGPEEFIPLAEEIGLIRPLGAWIIQETCRQAAVWARAGHEGGRRLDLTVSMNLSAGQLTQADLVDVVEAAVSLLVDDGGLRLCVELAESILTKEPDLTVETLHRLRALGVSIAIDDFGTGYASLSSLRQFPVDILKIDRAFVAGLGLGLGLGPGLGGGAGGLGGGARGAGGACGELDGATGDAAIVLGIIRLAAELGSTVIAEGVETAEQAEALRSMGCPQAQGFHFSKPQSARDIEALLGL